SLFPNVNYPRIRANLEAGERPAERMALEVTRPVEEALRGIPGVRNVQSRSSRGSAEIWLTFDWGDDMAAALLQAQAAANKMLPSLPAGTTLAVRQMDPTLFSTISYSLISDTRSLAELRDIAQYQLRPLLSTVPGVSRIDVQEHIRQSLGAEQKRLPDVRITKWYDQSDLITASAHSVRDAVVIGVILAAIVLLLFLRNWRITLVAALTVPIVLAVTALLL